MPEVIEKLLESTLRVCNFTIIQAKCLDRIIYWIRTFRLATLTLTAISGALDIAAGVIDALKA